MHRILGMLNRVQRWGGTISRARRMVPAQLRLPLLALAVVVVAGMLLWRTNWWVAGGFVAVALLVTLCFWLIKRFVRTDGTLEGLAGEGISDTARDWNRAIEEYRKFVPAGARLGFYVLIGEPQSGKSTTLMRSGLSFPVGMKEFPGGPGTLGCNWWFTDTAIFLDTAGRLSFPHTAHDPTATRKEWEWFLDRLRTFRPTCPINGVIVTIPCTSLLGDPEETRAFKADVIRKALVDLQTNLKIRFPVYVVITKSDLVGGFSQFCAHLKARGQLQLFGWSRPNANFDAPFEAEEFRSAFADILQRIRQRRLHFLNESADDGAARRHHMFAFPEALDRLRGPLEQYLELIFPDSRLVESFFLRGFYMTSGERKGVPIETIAGDVLGPVEIPQEEQAGDNRAHFVSDLYRRKVLREPGLIKPTERRTRWTERVRRWGYGTAVAAATAGTLIVGTWWLGIRNQVHLPLTTVISLHDGIADRPWTRRSAGPFSLIDSQKRLHNLEEILTTLEALAGSPQASSVIGAIENRTSLDTVGIFPGINWSQRRALIDNLWRAYRVGLVEGILEPLALDVSYFLAETAPGRIGPPEAFERYRQAITAQLALLCADVDPATAGAEGAKPSADEAAVVLGSRLRILLDFCRDYWVESDKYNEHIANLSVLTTPGLVDRISNAYEVLCRNESKIRRTAEVPVWPGTGAHVAWLGSPKDRLRTQIVLDNLKAALARANDRWAEAFAPTPQSWLGPDDLDDDATYHWWRIFRLRHDLAQVDELTRLEESIARSGDHTLAAWDRLAREWLAKHERLVGIENELRAMAETSSALSWEEAGRNLEEAWVGFYSPLLELAYASDIVERTFRAAIEEAKSRLQRAWDVAKAEYDQTYAGFETAGSTPQDKAADPWIALTSGQGGRGIHLTDVLEGVIADFAATRALVDESLSPWGQSATGNRWAGILDEQGGIALEPRPAEGQVNGLLSAQADRLTSFKTANGAPRIEAVRRVAVRAIVTRVLQQMTLATPSPPLVRARGIDPLNGVLEVPDEYGPGRMQQVLQWYLVPLIEWADTMAREFPPLDEPGHPGSLAELARALDTYGYACLNQWAELWTVTWITPLQDEFGSCSAKGNWDAFVAAVRNKFMPGEKKAKSAASNLSAYAMAGLAAMIIPDPPNGESAATYHLKKTISAWKQHAHDVATAAEFYMEAQASTIETPIEKLLEGIKQLGGLSQDDLLKALLEPRASGPSDFKLTDLMYFTSALDRLAAAGAEGHEQKPLPTDFVIVARQLAQLESRARALLTDVVAAQMKKDYAVLLQALSSGHGGKPLGYPLTNSQEDASRDDVTSFFDQASVFAKFKERFKSQFVLCGPKDRTGDWTRPDSQRYIAVQVPKHVHKLINWLDDLGTFLLGSTGMGGRLTCKVKRVACGGLDASVPYLYLDTSSESQSLPDPTVTSAYDLSWDFEHDDSVKLWAFVAAPDNHLAGFGFGKEGNAQQVVASGNFALLRFLHDNNSPDRVNHTDKGSCVEIRLNCRDDYRAGELAIQFDFKDRHYPAQPGTILPWPE